MPSGGRDNLAILHGERFGDSVRYVEVEAAILYERIAIAICEFGSGRKWLVEHYEQLLFTTDDVAKTLAQRLKRIRKRKKITQHQLAARSNVSYASLCRFEQTGLISLESFIKICMELGVIDEVKDLFTHPVYSSIEEVINDKR